MSMQPFATDFLKILEVQHTEMERSMDGLSQAALDWSPGPDMNSIAVLVAHVVGAERYWLGEVIAREPSYRDRPAEFQTSGLTAGELKERLKAATAYARRVLEPLTLEDLETTRIVPRDGSERGVAWCLPYILSHTATHVGHVQVTRQLWEQGEQR
jgi:uncharacterized damage-inducible protein DinB